MKHFKEPTQTPLQQAETYLEKSFEQLTYANNEKLQADLAVTEARARLANAQTSLDACLKAFYKENSE